MLDIDKSAQNTMRQMKFFQTFRNANAVSAGDVEDGVTDSRRLQEQVFWTDFIAKNV